MWMTHAQLPAAGLVVPVADAGKDDVVVAPMGRAGLRVKWQRSGRPREVRIGVEVATTDLQVAAKLADMAAEFGGEVVAALELDDVDASLYVIRELDVRRHVVVAVSRLDERHVVQGSLEASGDQPVEIGDEWARLQSLLTSIVDTGRRDTDPSASAVISPTNVEIGLRFDLPPGVYANGVAYGMDQLVRGRDRLVGRLVYGGLAARGATKARAALDAAATDPGLRDADVRTDDDVSWLLASIVDASGHEGELVAAARAVRGISLVCATFVLPGEDRDSHVEYVRHCVSTATRLEERGDGRPTADVRDILSKMDSFRRRLDPAGHRVTGD